MLYGFKIAVSLKTPEISSGYLQSLTTAAQQALCRGNLDRENAFSLCEYLDCVDAGDLPASQPLYRQAVSALTDYIDTCQDPSDVQALAQKSWAALTLSNLVQAAKAELGMFAPKVRTLRAMQ